MVTTSIDEPKVSVHGIPQSQYESQVPSGSAPVGAGGAPSPGLFTKLRMNIEQHWPVYTVIIGFATVVVMLLINRNNNNSSLATTTDQTNGGLSGTPLSGDQLYGAQLDSDYQQLMSFQNVQVGLLQQLLNKLGNPSGSPSQNNFFAPPPVPVGYSGTYSQYNPNFTSNIAAGIYNSDLTAQVYYPNGIPIESSPLSGATITGYLPYGSAPNVGSSMVAGQNQVGPNNLSSNQWYSLTSGGYINQLDAQEGLAAVIQNGSYTTLGSPGGSGA